MSDLEQVAKLVPLLSPVAVAGIALFSAGVAAAAFQRVKKSGSESLADLATGAFVLGAISVAALAFRMLTEFYGRQDPPRPSWQVLHWIFECAAALAVVAWVVCAVICALAWLVITIAEVLRFARGPRRGTQLHNWQSGLQMTETSPAADPSADAGAEPLPRV